MFSSEGEKNALDEWAQRQDLALWAERTADNVNHNG